MNAHLCGVDPVVADDQIPAELRNQLNVLTTNPVVEVPVRKQGVLAGEANRCYWNANVAAQTFGGEAIYGWSINDFGDHHGCLTLVGHAVWKTPDGKLVDITPNFDSKRKREQKSILFVPYTNQLVMNGKAVEKINTFYFPTCVRGVGIGWFVHAEHHRTQSRCAEVVSSIWGEDLINPNPFVNKLIESDAFIVDQVEGVLNGLIEEFPEQTVRLTKLFLETFRPLIRVVDKSTPIKVKCDPAKGFQHFSAKSLKEKGNIFVKGRGYDLTCDFAYGDMTWDNGTYKVPTFTGISTTNGKSITDYQPLQSLLDQHEPPKSKKQRRKVEQIAQKHNLTPNEVVMLSNPYLFPHPTLVKKAGNAKVPRIYTNASVGVGASSKGFA